MQTDVWDAGPTENLWSLSVESFCDEIDCWQKTQDFSQDVFPDQDSIESNVGSRVTLLLDVSLDVRVGNDSIHCQREKKESKVEEKAVTE